MKDWLSNSSFVGSVILVGAVTQAVIYGLRAALAQIKDKTATQWDNKAYDTLGVVESVLDAVTGNFPHKEGDPNANDSKPV